jgi:Tfp pilus assembly protein PilO
MQIPIISNLILKNIKKDEYARYLSLVPNFKKEKTQKFTTAILTISASIILAIFAVSPTLSTIAGLQKQLDDGKFVDQKLQQKINDLSLLQQKYANLQDDLPIVYAAFPTSSQIPLLLADMQGAGNESSVKITNFQTFQVEISRFAIQNKKYSSFDFSIIAQGDYQNMLAFLDKIVNFQRLVTINQVSIAKTNGINVTSLQITIKGTAYFKENL